MIDGQNQKNIMQVSLINAKIMESPGSFNLTLGSNAQGIAKSPLTKLEQTMLRVYIYIDDTFQFKTEVFGQSNSPILDLKVKIELPSSSGMIRLDMYDASGLTEEELLQIQNDYDEQQSLPKTNRGQKGSPPKRFTHHVKTNSGSIIEVTKLNHEALEIA